jgi:hypothetical protein
MHVKKNERNAGWTGRQASKNPNFEAGNHALWQINEFTYSLTY